MQMRAIRTVPFLRNSLLRAGASIFLCAALSACTSVRPSREPSDSMSTSKQIGRHFKTTRTERLEADYLVHLPAGYNARSGPKWPLILFLHGAGERGDDLSKVAFHGPPHLATNQFDLPFVVVSPQCKAGRIWSNDLLLALLDHALAKYRVDPTRVYLTGLSMGGYGTWSLGLAYPEKFAAIVPICGGGDIIGPMLSGREKASPLKTLGIWAFHGAKDTVVPLSESERMVAIAKRAGVEDVKLTVYPEANHNSWTATYTNRAVYDWMLEHRRQ